jgi:hypothetical protein
MVDAIFWMAVSAMVVLGLLCCYSAWVDVRSENDDGKHRRRNYKW